MPATALPGASATLARNMLCVPGQAAAGTLQDAPGRRIGILLPGANDVGYLAAGVYSVRNPAGAGLLRVVIVKEPQVDRGTGQL